MNLHHSLTRHLRIRESAERLARRMKMEQFVAARRRSGRTKVQLRTRDGMLLLASLLVFVAAVFTLVYFVWYLPGERAIR